MELGSPPLYMELNRACREEDHTLLPLLGPFAHALAVACDLAEMKKKKEDKILAGKDMVGVNYNLAGCFLLWRGSAMK